MSSCEPIVNWVMQRQLHVSSTLLKRISVDFSCPDYSLLALFLGMGKSSTRYSKQILGDMSDFISS